MSIRDRLFWEDQARAHRIAEQIGVPHVECVRCGVDYAMPPALVCLGCKWEAAAELGSGSV